MVKNVLQNMELSVQNKIETDKMVDRKNNKSSGIVNDQIVEKNLPSFKKQINSLVDERGRVNRSKNQAAKIQINVNNIQKSKCVETTKEVVKESKFRA